MYSERFTHLARPRTEIAWIDLASATLDLLYTPERLQGSDEYCPRRVDRLCDEIEQEMYPIRAIDVDAARRTEQGCVSFSHTAIRMASRVIGAVCLGLDDPPSHAVEVDLAGEQISSDEVGRP